MLGGLLAQVDLLAGKTMDIPLPRSPDRRPSGRRVLLAMTLGHAAGAYAFCLTTILFSILADLRIGGLAAVKPSSWRHLFEGIGAFPVVTGLLGLWSAIAMIPWTLLTLPIAWMAAHRLRTGAAATVALGALTGLLPALIAFHGAPTIEIQPYVSAAAAGAMFAGILWLLCIKPRAHACAADSG